MSHERIKRMKENLMSCIESQLCNIYEADTEELGEAIDMLKDMEEALYYCTITEAMEGKKSHETEEQQSSQSMYYRPYYPMYARDMNNRESRSYMPDYDDGRMFNEGNSGGGSSSYYSEPMMMRDPREGRSYESRRMYLESKHSGHDKAAQLRELEKYMQELTQDMVDMIQEATPEEKQYLEKKISALATKIGQMK